VLFLQIKGLKTKDILKENCCVYGDKCLSRKAVQNLVEKLDKRFADDKRTETEVWTWLRQQSKDFYFADFNALVNRPEKCIYVGGGYVLRRG
jgi:hypothetical protein